MIINNANIIREKRKTLKIIINDDGQLSVICPFNLPISKINEILLKKEKIINKKIKNIKNINDKYRDIIEIKKITLLGKEYFVIPTEKVNKAFFTEDMFLVPKKYIELNRLSFYIKKNLKEIAKKIIIPRTNELYKLFPTKTKNFNKISIGSFKAKWGSCDNLGNIKFNWKLIMLNPLTIDFVIFHELTHLIELNHSKSFYNILEKMCPNWKEYRKELKNLSFLLNLYN